MRAPRSAIRATRAVKYFGWKDLDEIIGEFHIAAAQIKDEEIVFALQTTSGYDCTARIVFIQKDQLYLVEGSHCSCFLYKGQWTPTRTTWPALKMMKPLACSHVGDLTQRLWAEMIKTKRTPTGVG